MRNWREEESGKTAASFFPQGVSITGDRKAPSRHAKDCFGGARSVSSGGDWTVAKGIGQEESASCNLIAGRFTSGMGKRV